MRIFEKHRNGAILDVYGEPERAAQILVEWRQYQDKSTPLARPVGFVKSEEERHE